jgi:hypothetical protein
MPVFETYFNDYTVEVDGHKLAFCQEQTAYNFSLNMLRNADLGYKTFVDRFREDNSEGMGGIINHQVFFAKLVTILAQNANSLRTRGIHYRAEDRKDMAACRGNFLRLVLLLTSEAPAYLGVKTTNETAAVVDWVLGYFE